MARKSRERGLVALALITVALAAPPLGLCQSGQPSVQELTREKTRQEIRQLQLENQSKSGLRGFVSAYGVTAGFLTGFVALLGVFVTYRSQKREERRQHDLDRGQRDNERRQRDLEGKRRRDDGFTKILTDLGADSEALQAAAAVSLLTYLRPNQQDYHRQVRLITLANLKVQHGEAVVRLLERVLESALRTSEPLDPLERDFSRASMRYVDLSGLDLREADVGFALMRGANCENTNLWRARGYSVELENARLSGVNTDLREIRFGKAKCAGAIFRDANLRAAHFEEAILQGAQFQKARLQSAHFNNADLAGARFEQADLNDTYFTGAVLDEVALRSITRALNWEKAHFTPEQTKRLKELGQPGPGE